MTTLIIIAIVVVLAVLGATNRKKIQTWVRSETNEFVEKKTNNVKVAKLKISDSKKKLTELVESAGELYAELESQKKLYDKAFRDKDTCLQAAKKAKKDGNESNAKTKLREMKAYDEQLVILDENIKILESKKIKVENNVAKLKAIITSYDIKVKGLDARQKTNKVLTSLRVGDITGNTIGDTIEITEENITKEELKLEYLESLDEDVEDNDASLDEEYEKL